MIANETNMIPTTNTASASRAAEPKKMCKLEQQRGRRKFFLSLGAYTILAIVLAELVLVSPSLRPVEAKKKKKIIKKIKEILPLIALLKRKKIVLLPIPM